MSIQISLRLLIDSSYLYSILAFMQTKEIPVRWSPPEVLQGNCRHARSDIWSFGIFLWELFTMGETPYSDLQAEAAVGVFVVREGGRLCRAPLASDGLHTLMTECWATTVDSRPDSHTVLRALECASRESALENRSNYGASLSISVSARDHIEREYSELISGRGVFISMLFKGVCHRPQLETG